VQIVSRGVYCRGLSAAEKDAATYGKDADQAENELAVFDRRAEFIPKYAARRASLENYLNDNDKNKGTYKILPEDLGQRVHSR